VASGNYRADHVGSLIPPLRRDGGPDPDSVIGAIELQRDAPMDVFTDGDPWRHGEDSPAALRERDARRFTGEGPGEHERLRSLAPSWARLKLTLLLHDDRDAVRDRANRLLGWGLDYLQLDARERYLPAGGADRGLRERLELDRQLLDSLVVPENATTALYLGEWGVGGAHEDRDEVIEAIFALPVERFVLGLPPARGRDLSFLRHVPDERFVVLGLIDAGSAELEEPDSLLAVIDAAGELHGDRLAVSPSRGFADMPAPAGMTLALQRKKLELVADVARMIWGTEL